ncbi:hypothetical protein ES23_11260 [Staphylococcus haemolyticus]|nr:hypothetical protein ES23_11260 [Staphylococcus haemolyticus]KGJ27354.1 hypothetical protein ES24_06390 [Staphylococcus haemolyticus]
MEILQTKQAGVGAPAERISHGNSTNKASWGWGPSRENFTWKFYKQSKLGLGPQQREFHMEILQNHYFSFISVSYIV